MEDRYKVTFEVTMFEHEKHELVFHLSEIIEKMFEVFPENLEIEKISSEEETKK